MKKRESYSFAQYKELLQEIRYGANNLSFCVCLDLKLTKHQLNKALVKIFKIFPVMHATLDSYGIMLNQNTVNQQFVGNFVEEITDNKDDLFVLYTLQNKPLDIANGRSSYIILNQHPTCSSLVITVSHIVIDGITVLHLVEILLFLLTKQRMRYQLFKKDLICKHSLSKYRDKHVPQKNPFFLSDDMELNKPRKVKAPVNFIRYIIKIQDKKNLKSLMMSVAPAALHTLIQVCTEEEKVQLRKLINLRLRCPAITKFEIGCYYSSKEYIFGKSQIDTFSKAIGLFKSGVLLNDSLEIPDIGNKCSADKYSTITISNLGIYSRWTKNLKNLKNLILLSSIFPSLKPGFFIGFAALASELQLLIIYDESQVEYTKARTYCDLLISNLAVSESQIQGVDYGAELIKDNF